MSADEILALPPLAREFYLRPAAEVARDLIGHAIVHREGRRRVTAGRIVEAEAYLGLADAAAHAYRGLTARTRVLFGPPGHAYVYIIYGMYDCLNLVAEPEGSPGCVLIRALEPLAGLDAMRIRRAKARRVEDLCSGPGRLTAALGVTKVRHYGADVVSGALSVRRLPLDDGEEIAVTPRIGIKDNIDWPLRFVVAGSPFASR